MEAQRFDALTRSFSGSGSRRTLLRAVLSGGLVAGLGGLSAERVAAACKPNGEKCRKSNPQACCSGICRKKNGVRQCRPARGALGCTNEQSSCNSDQRFACPRNPQGSCQVTLEGKPFCASKADCIDCRSNEQCVRKLGVPGSRCIVCKACSTTNNRACVRPAPKP
jgi:hypothetical protein